ncbi:uncharacterized protein LOC111316238 [Durio zibethinus]|uniref:Uncharacterized protein LOC111316238 n=1 Tax=Durio zibethinus TaxID=66656 RepID=A0A6P6BA66_DURZI|nr:uncharacterized protein LOC111316238 [Durio zibethinus]
MGEMNQAIRSVSSSATSNFLVGTQKFSDQLRDCHKFFHASRKPTKHGAERNNPKEKTGDLMSHSFGEGYATRSDEEGFGGIYGGNQSKSEIQTDKEINENHPAYDKSQGTEVKEKEKARHQTHASN